MSLEASYCGVPWLCGGEEFHEIDTVIKRQGVAKIREISRGFLAGCFFYCGKFNCMVYFIGVSAFFAGGLPAGSRLRVADIRMGRGAKRGKTRRVPGKNNLRRK